MPKFLSRAEVYRILQRELPDGVYPDGAENDFYSTADMAAIADCAATGYANLERVYENSFPKTADERITDWEFVAFGKLLSGSLSLPEKQDKVSARIRARKGLTKQDMIDIVKSIIGTDKLVEVANWGCHDGGWSIGESELSISTILNGARQVDVTGTAICEADASDYGKTDAEWAIMQEEAYTYEVLIYDYTLSADERTEIDSELSIFEPARSQHVITDGLDSNDMLEGDA